AVAGRSRQSVTSASAATHVPGTSLDTVTNSESQQCDVPGTRVAPTVTGRGAPAETTSKYVRDSAGPAHDAAFSRHGRPWASTIAASSWSRGTECARSNSV